MNKWEMKHQFLIDEVEEMKKHAWIESEKAGHDVGAEAMRDWVTKYAAQFREDWEKAHGKVIEDVKTNI